MGNKSAKKIRGHDDLLPGEEVVDACYGLGKGFLKLTDTVVTGRMQRYSGDADAATVDPDGSEAAKIDRTGIVAFTDQRLLFLPVKTAIMKPKAVAAAWPLEQVTGATWEKNILAVGFTDGSIGGLHVPRAEHPTAFVDALNALVDPDGCEAQSSPAMTASSSAIANTSASSTVSSLSLIAELRRSGSVPRPTRSACLDRRATHSERTLRSRSANAPRRAASPRRRRARLAAGPVPPDPAGRAPPPAGGACGRARVPTASGSLL